MALPGEFDISLTCNVGMLENRRGGQEVMEWDLGSSGPPAGPFRSYCLTLGYEDNGRVDYYSGS